MARSGSGKKVALSVALSVLDSRYGLLPVERHLFTIVLFDELLDRCWVRRWTIICEESRGEGIRLSASSSCHIAT